MNRHLFEVISAATIRADLILTHTGDVEQTESYQITTDGDFLMCPYEFWLCEEREPGSSRKIIDRIKIGEISGTHVLPASTGFVHWHLTLRGTLKP